MKFDIYCKSSNVAIHDIVLFKYRSNSSKCEFDITAITKLCMIKYKVLVNQQLVITQFRIKFTLFKI